MTEERALVVRQSRQITESGWKTIMSIAPTATAARMFGVTQEQAAIVMLTGYELGLPISAAFDVIYVSRDGKRVLRPKGALGLVRSSGLLEKFDWESDDTSATVTMKRVDGPEKSMTLTIGQAQTAGWKSAAWQTTPQNMLRWRLIGWLCDLLFPDVLLGLSIADDSYLPVEITSDGDVIDGTTQWITPPVTELTQDTTAPTSVAQSSPQPPTYTEPPIPQPEPAMTLADLLQTWNAARIVEVYGGVPGTPAQVAEAKEKLEQADAS